MLVAGMQVAVHQTNRKRKANKAYNIQWRVQGEVRPSKHCIQDRDTYSNRAVNHPNYNNNNNNALQNNNSEGLPVTYTDSLTYIKK